MNITRDMTVGEIVELVPDAVDVLLEYGLHCVGCGASMWETVEEGALGHGMSEDLLESLLEELNELGKQQETKNPQ